MDDSQDYCVPAEASSFGPRVIRLVKRPARSTLVVGLGLCSSVAGMRIAEDSHVRKNALEVGWDKVIPYRWPISHDDIPERSGGGAAWLREQNFPLASGSGTTLVFDSGPALQAIGYYPRVRVSGDGLPVAKDPVFRELLGTYARAEGICVEIVA